MDNINLRLNETKDNTTLTLLDINNNLFEESRSDEVEVVSLTTDTVELSVLIFYIIAAIIIILLIWLIIVILTRPTSFEILSVMTSTKSQIASVSDIL
jgi:hypothetical protein